SNILALAMAFSSLRTSWTANAPLLYCPFAPAATERRQRQFISDEVILKDVTTDGGTVQEFVARWARGLLQGRKSCGRHHASGDRNRSRTCCARLPDGRRSEVSRPRGRERGRRRVQPLLPRSEKWRRPPEAQRADRSLDSRGRDSG